MARPPHHSSMIRRLEAFTLVELLLVITIIAILVSITIPALGSSRETARRVKCLANLKGLGVGIAAYLNDSKDTLPVRIVHERTAVPRDPEQPDDILDYFAVPIPEPSDPNDPHSPMLKVSDALICPGDRVGKDPASNYQPVWQDLGCSYEYLAGEMILFAGQLSLPDPQGGVSMLYRQPQWKDLPVLLDHDDWHPQRRTGTPRNALYFGGWQADWAGTITSFDSQNPLLRDLVCDFTKFCGRPAPGCN